MDHHDQFLTEIITEIEKKGQSPCPQCQSHLTRECFQQGHFDWCITHQSTAVVDDEVCTHAKAKRSACSIAMWVDLPHIAHEST